MKYNYEGHTKSGEPKKGEIESSNLEDAAQKLRENGIYAMNIAVEAIQGVLEHKTGNQPVEQTKQEPKQEPKQENDQKVNIGAVEALMEAVGLSGHVVQENPVQPVQEDRQVMSSKTKMETKEEEQMENKQSEQYETPIPKTAWQTKLDSELNAWVSVMGYSTQWLMSKNGIKNSDEMVPMSLDLLRNILDRAVQEAGSQALKVKPSVSKTVVGPKTKTNKRNRK